MARRSEKCEAGQHGTCKSAACIKGGCNCHRRVTGFCNPTGGQNHELCPYEQRNVYPDKSIARCTCACHADQVDRDLVLRAIRATVVEK